MPSFISRRALVMASALLPVLTPAQAQVDGEPRLPAMMKIVVPFSAGASNDAMARAVAPLLARRLGNTVIIENKPGAAGVIGADYVAKGPADGSVLLLTSSTFLTAAVTQAKLPYDPVASFVPVSMNLSVPCSLGAKLPRSGGVLLPTEPPRWRCAGRCRR